MAVASEVVPAQAATAPTHRVHFGKDNEPLSVVVAGKHVVAFGFAAGTEQDCRLDASFITCPVKIEDEPVPVKVPMPMVFGNEVFRVKRDLAPPCVHFCRRILHPCVLVLIDLADVVAHFTGQSFDNFELPSHCANHTDDFSTL